MAPLHLSPLEKKTAEQKGKLIFEDEASFRQDSTLYRTWSQVGQQPLVPVTGARKSAKIFGCVEVYDATFVYDSNEVFNGRTYVDFLDAKVAPCFIGLGVGSFTFTTTLPTTRSEKSSNGFKRTESGWKSNPCLPTLPNSTRRSLCGIILECRERTIAVS